MQDVATPLDQIVNLHQARRSSQVQDEQKKPDPNKSEDLWKQTRFSFLEVLSSKLQWKVKKNICC